MTAYSKGRKDQSGKISISVFLEVRKGKGNKGGSSWRTVYHDCHRRKTPLPLPPDKKLWGVMQGFGGSVGKDSPSLPRRTVKQATGDDRGEKFLSKKTKLKSSPNGTGKSRKRSGGPGRISGDSLKGQIFLRYIIKKGEEKGQRT